MVAALVYVAVFEPISIDSQYNVKRGLVACIIVFVLLCSVVAPNSPFKRPHPGTNCIFLWNVVLPLNLCTIKI
jgi:phosphatidylserine synthase 2